MTSVGYVMAREGVLRVLAGRHMRLDGICQALWDEPGYWNEWPTVEEVLRELRAEGLVERTGTRWHLVPPEETTNQ